MKIRIEPEKLTEIRDFLNIVIESNEVYSRTRARGAILSNDQGHFTHVKFIKKCGKCGQEFKPDRLSFCPNCRALVWDSGSRYEPIGYKLKPGAIVGGITQ